MARPPLTRPPALPTGRRPSRRGEIPWALLLALLGVVVLFMLRRFLRLFFPMLFLLLVLAPLLWYLWRQYKYRDVWAVVPEYEKLVALLRRLRLSSYRAVVEASMKHLLAARDRAERFQEYLAQEPPHRLRERLRDLERQFKDTHDPEKRRFLEKTLADSRETLAHLDELQEFLRRYEDSKAVLAGHFKNTRLRLELDEMRFAEGIAYQSDEVDRLMTEIKAFDSMYETVDRRTGPRTTTAPAAAESDEAPAATAPPPPDRQAQ
ncbi:MAG: hypothetical protein OZSIB_1677 [Candidatus Ozemobacter sibiricus]|jgi:hypothetical protein|uniref:5-bromo-4-chloroindolyl phosphate hydrolysis protein n=1 Tax=Candidatus Ozemobacter sibiricus TaxID=2268124 RepID=A0A367ZLA9_9BACT|nr:MAG: hypothetical protein OZSIB_1677 [Candidatus Ozemobacter sibiricus]